MAACHGCEVELPAVPYSGASGYSEDDEGHRYCYECCGTRDRGTMIETGHAVLYLVRRDRVQYVTNWPGTLVLRVTACRSGGHNIAGVRYDVWFVGPDDKRWHGVQYGDFTQLCHCRRLCEGPHYPLGTHGARILQVPGRGNAR